MKSASSSSSGINSSKAISRGELIGAYWRPLQTTPMRGLEDFPSRAFQSFTLSESALRYGVVEGTVSRVVPNANGKLIKGQRNSWNGIPPPSSIGMLIWTPI